MFDIGWSELFVILVVALVVVGPKDLPKVMRWVGYWTNRARMMAGQFQRVLDDMAREAELDKINKELQQATRIDMPDPLHSPPPQPPAAPVEAPVEASGDAPAAPDTATAPGAEDADPAAMDILPAPTPVAAELEHGAAPDAHNPTFQAPRP